jgi:hypothetical protein
LRVYWRESLALAGDGQSLNRLLRFRGGFGYRLETEFDYGLGVELCAAGRRTDDGILPLRGGKRRAGGVEGYGLAAACPDVDAEEGHCQSSAIP